jgi:hypothetical protein
MGSSKKTFKSTDVKADSLVPDLGKGIDMVQSNVTYRTVIEEVEKIPAEYLPFLLEMTRAFRASITLKPAEESFRQGWQEALGGEMQPVSELWKDIDVG